MSFVVGPVVVSNSGTAAALLSRWATGVAPPPQTAQMVTIDHTDDEPDCSSA